MENKEKKITLKAFDYQRFKEWKRQKLLSSEKKQVDIVEYAHEFTALIFEMKNDLKNYKGSDDNKKKLKIKYARIYFCYQVFLNIFSKTNLLNDKLNIYVDATEDILKENNLLKTENEKLIKEIEQLKTNLENEL